MQTSDPQSISRKMTPPTNERIQVYLRVVRFSQWSEGVKLHRLVCGGAQDRRQRY